MLCHFPNYKDEGKLMSKNIQILTIMNLFTLRGREGREGIVKEEKEEEHVDRGLVTTIT